MEKGRINFSFFVETSATKSSKLSIHDALVHNTMQFLLLKPTSQISFVNAPGL